MKIKDIEDMDDAISLAQSGMPANNKLIELINIVVNKRVHELKRTELKFNNCIKASIIKDNGDGTYEVQFPQKAKFYTENGFELKDNIKTIPAITGMKFQKGDFVWIEKINNDFNSQFIKTKVEEK